MLSSSSSLGREEVHTEGAGTVLEGKGHREPCGRAGRGPGPAFASSRPWPVKWPWWLSSQNLASSSAPLSTRQQLPRFCSSSFAHHLCHLYFLQCLGKEHLHIKPSRSFEFGRLVFPWKPSAIGLYYLFGGNMYPWPIRHGWS